MKENDRFYIEISSYSHISLICTYVDDYFGYLKAQGQEAVEYKYKFRGKKLYRWASDSWELTDYELKEETISSTKNVSVWENGKRLEGYWEDSDFLGD